MSEEVSATNDTPSLPKLDVAEVLGDAMALVGVRRSLFVGAALACTLPNFARYAHATHPVEPDVETFA